MKIAILEKLFQQAQAEAELSTCSRLNVGAIIADERGVILSSGYNGALPGLPHCDHTCTCQAPEDQSDLHKPSCSASKPCEIAMHAEANAILWAARRGVATEGHSLVTTHSPCFRCAQLIIQVGIKHVYALKDYRDDMGKCLLQDAGVMLG